MVQPPRLTKTEPFRTDSVPLGRRGPGAPGVLASLPRRQFITTETAEVTPPMVQAVTFDFSYIRVLQSLLIWLFIGISFLAGGLWDRLRGRSSPERRAARLRRAFERSGGTIRKMGQLLALRIDLLPWAFCAELAKIVDTMPPFPVERAIQRVEQSTGEPLGDTFRQFDPEPIDSSSVACVYQAILAGGKKVVVKVRRPGAGERLMAAYQALAWILGASEFLSVFRPGFTLQLRRDLRETIEDELNFLLEARNQSLFRRAARKSGKNFFTAPRVYFELCSQDVIVEQFAAGMWLWELIEAVEHNDPQALARAARLNIDPDLVARRLLWVNFWGLEEHLLFRADLQSHQVIVRRNSKLAFLDFTSMGALSQENRQALGQTLSYAHRRDAMEMAQASMILLEPLPPVDTIKLAKDLEETFWQYLYALESKHVAWWEKTCARLWLGFVRVSKEHNITINIQVLRMIRACLRTDTIAARLYPNIDHIRQYRNFSRYRARNARKRVERRIRDQFQQGIEGQVFLQMEEIADTGERVFRQFQRALALPVFKFNAVLGKSVYSFSILVQFLWQLAVLTALAAGGLYAAAWFTQGEVLPVMDALARVLSNRVYQLAVIGILILSLRTILFRLGDKEI